MTKITTATGKEFDTGYVAENKETGTLYIRIRNAEMSYLESVFSDPNETRELLYNETTLTGYTIFKEVLDEGDSIRVRLKSRGNGNAIDNNSGS